MMTKQVTVNNVEFRVTLTDQIIGHVNNLKKLYLVAYEDPEGFEQVSAEISNTITEIALAVEPKASDSDLDGLIQAIIKIVDDKVAEMEQQLQKHAKLGKIKTSKKKPKKQ